MTDGLEIYYKMLLELDQLYNKRDIYETNGRLQSVSDECNDILSRYITYRSKFGYGVESYIKSYDVNVFLDYDYYSFDLIVKNFDNLFKYTSLIREMVYIMIRVDYIAKICFNDKFGLPRSKPWDFNHLCIYGPDIRYTCKYDLNGNEIYDNNELFYPRNLNSLLKLMNALRKHNLRPRLHIEKTDFNTFKSMKINTEPFDVYYQKDSFTGRALSSEYTLLFKSKIKKVR